jgi:xanthine dehydrogenase YagR molybdenum-binding subunit
MTKNPDSSQMIGQALARIDGPPKVSGLATYSSDVDLPGMLYAVPVGSTIAHGKIASLDPTAAEAMPGVRAVLHRANLGKLFRASTSMTAGMLDERRPPFEDDVVRYYGQFVAVVVADTVEQASAAAAAVRVTYDRQTPSVDECLAPSGDIKVESSRGDPDKAFADAPVTVDETYVTPVETHNAIELHASVADWNGESFTLYETTQAVVNYQDVMTQMLGVPKESLRVISRFLGSGFGGKLWPWPHALLAASASRHLGRPVKLVLSRKMSFQSAGHRPLTQQRIRLSASADGILTSLQHDYLNHTSMLDDYSENCGEATPYLYGTANLRLTAGLARRNVGTPTSMRGPGAVPGLFATESALDELAIKLAVDPVEFRLRNEPAVDPGSHLPFSSRHLSECLSSGAERFGWARRTPQVGSMKQDGVTLGWGMAGCSWLALRMPCEASVELKADGTARVACGTQDIGTGSYTVLAQLVSSHTGIATERIEVVLGDSSLPPGPFSGGSTVTASVIPAVAEAARAAIDAAIATALQGEDPAFKGRKAEELAFTAGRIYVKGGDPADGLPFQDALRAAGLNLVKGKGKSEGGFDDPLKKQFSIQSYGAHFVEVGWEPEIARLRIRRVVTTIDGGRIVNPRMARNQIEGAVVMGVGMALFEHTRYDAASGAPVNSNMADYVMATHADAPQIDVRFLDYPDLLWNELGARGIGEIGLAGVAAAITSAVYHATGVRVRKLPVRIEDLLGAPVLA